MSKIEIEKEIDGLGRVVIPKDFRKIANIKLKSKVLLSLSSGGVFITPFKKVCALCGDELMENAECRLCQGCILKVKENY
jgi:transcriptional pleiotropic regulator of transition state genes